MKRLVPIIALLVLGGISYCAFVIVSNSKTSEYKQQVDTANQQLADEKKAHAADVQVFKDKQQKIQESLTILFPERKEQIENAFNPKPATQPTSQPTTKPAGK
jgi:hypothetical protein